MDKYDRAIKYLTKAVETDPGAITRAWSNPHINRDAGSVLFQFVHKISYSPSCGCGCLTQIKASPLTKAQTESLTERIRADDRIPNRIPDQFCPKSEMHAFVAKLPVFAEWQRIIDRELNRVG